MERLATDRHYFARPVRTLFNDIRCLFPMDAQMRAYRVIEHHVLLAAAYVDSQARDGVTFDGSPLRCHATTRKGTSCQRVPLPASKYCPSHKHLEEDARGAQAHGRLGASRALRPAGSDWAPEPARPSFKGPSSGPHAGSVPRMVLGVDVGGTFTDAVLLTGGRRGHRQGAHHSRRPVRGRDGRGASRRWSAAGRRRGDVERLVHGMTVGTNALLEGRTARTALVATEGFTDLEELGRQARPDLYRLCAAHPEPLVPGRAQGRRARAVRARRSAARARPRGARSAGCAELERPRSGAVAVCLLWGFRHPEHERAVAEAIEAALPGAHVSTSHETAGVFREYERLATTVVDAALSPLLRTLPGAADRAHERRRACPTRRSCSPAAAWPTPPRRRRTGRGRCSRARPAARRRRARAARRAGGGGAVGLDMGGTSCDVSLVLDGRVAVTGGREVGGRSLALPMVDVHTVGAGGGSIAWADAGGALRVGPRSAGRRSRARVLRARRPSGPP